LKRFLKFIGAGAGTVGLYIFGVWFGSEILGLPVLPLNVVLYTLASLASFAINYKWVFAAESGAGQALFRYGMLQVAGIVMNAIWVEAGLRLTNLWPWVIAATWFILWPLLSYAVQRRLVFTS